MHQIIEERLICCLTNEEKLLANAFTVHKFAVSKILVLTNFSLRNSVLNVSGKCSKPVSQNLVTAKNFTPCESQKCCTKMLFNYTIIKVIVFIF